MDVRSIEAIEDALRLAESFARGSESPPDESAVAAIDEETAYRALSLIEVQYEPMPAVITVEEALAEGAPLVRGAGRRRCGPSR